METIEIKNKEYEVTPRNKKMLNRLKKAIYLFEEKGMNPKDVADELEFELRSLRTQLRNVCSYKGFVTSKINFSNDEVETFIVRHQSGESSIKDMAEENNVSIDAIRRRVRDRGYSIVDKKFVTGAKKIESTYDKNEVRVSKPNIWNKILSNKKLSYKENKRLFV